jgi:cold-inducible RNA-binding protein
MRRSPVFCQTEAWPAREDVVSVRLFIGNLPYSATEADLRALFSEVAEPQQVVLPTDRETGRPRGFAFVDFAERDHAEQVINRYNGQPYNGRPLAVSEARAREDRPAGPRPGGYGGGGFGGGAPRPAGGFGGPPAGGGFGGPRPGGPPRPFVPRDPGGVPTGPETRRARGPAKGPVRKQTYEKPRGPIKQRPVSRLYDEDEDLEATVEFDDPAASRAADAPETDGPDADAPEVDGPDAGVRHDRTDDDE